MSERIGTTCVQGGWRPGDGEPRQVPIYQNTTWKYDTSEHMGRLFDLEESGYFYTRLANPTNDAVAAKIAELEGGCAAMLTSSGQAANFFAVFNIAGAGDHVVASSAIYGGTYNLLAHTMGRMGLECTFVDPHPGQLPPLRVGRRHRDPLHHQVHGRPRRFRRRRHRGCGPL